MEEGHAPSAGAAQSTPSLTGTVLIPIPNPSRRCCGSSSSPRAWHLLLLPVFTHIVVTPLRVAQRSAFYHSPNAVCHAPSSIHCCVSPEAILSRNQKKLPVSRGGWFTPSHITKNRLYTPSTDLQRKRRPGTPLLTPHPPENYTVPTTSNAVVLAEL